MPLCHTLGIRPSALFIRITIAQIFQPPDWAPATTPFQKFIFNNFCNICEIEVHGWMNCIMNTLSDEKKCSSSFFELNNFEYWYLLWECIKTVGLLGIRKSNSHSRSQRRMKNNSSTLIPSSKIHRWYCPYTLAIYNHIFRANAVSTNSEIKKKKGGRVGLA